MIRVWKKYGLAVDKGWPGILLINAFHEVRADLNVASVNQAISASHDKGLSNSSNPSADH